MEILPNGETESSPGNMSIYIKLIDGEPCWARYSFGVVRRNQDDKGSQVECAKGE